MARMIARYNGQCAVCGERIRAGETIEYDRAQGGARHPDCSPFVAPEGAIWISDGEGYGGHPFSVGQIVRNPHHGQDIPAFFSEERRAEAERQGAAEYLRVLHATRHYYRDDGFSFGVGDESGYVYSACCLPATDEESAPLRAQAARQAERVAARAAVAEIQQRIEREGDYPQPAEVTPDVRELFNTRNIYGGGSRFLLAPGEVWYCRGNGRDGDDWSYNNLGSEIAHRLPDPDGAIAAELERLAAVLTSVDEDSHA